MTKKLEIGYKIVNNPIKGKFLSFWMITGGVFYQINKRTFPKKDCGPLCVFTHLNLAEEFLKRLTKDYYLNYNIFYCLYKPTKINKVWNDLSLSIPTNKLPVGTALADFVTLKKKVKS